MDKNRKIDMHIHSDFSDGTDNFQQLFEKLIQNGIDTFSLTDHDTDLGCKYLLEELIPEGMRFIPGIEFSCKTDKSKCHILGYDFAIGDKHIIDAVRLGKRARDEKLIRRLDYLRDVHSITFDHDEINFLFGEFCYGKLGLANVMVAKGVAKDNEDAIKNYINGCKTNNSRIDARIAIDAIISAGGIPVWAHPLGGEGEKHLTEERFRETLQELIAYGIKGLECWYSRYTEEEVNFLLKEAEENGLLISGGSDYHGKNKNIPIGCLNSDSILVYEHQLTILDYIK